MPTHCYLQGWKAPHLSHSCNQTLVHHALKNWDHLSNTDTNACTDRFPTTSRGADGQGA